MEATADVFTPLKEKLGIEVVEELEPEFFLARESGREVLFSSVYGSTFARMVFGNKRRPPETDFGNAVIEACMYREGYYGLISPSTPLSDSFLLRAVRLRELSEENGIPFILVGIFRPYLKGNTKGTLKEFLFYLERIREFLKSYCCLEVRYREYGKVTVEGEKLSYVIAEG